MAKLIFSPLLTVRPPIVGPMQDKAIRVTWDAPMEEATIYVAGGQARIHAMWSSANQRWQNIEATVLATCTSTTAARINRLLTGTGAPRLETYHRTQSIVMRAPHKAYPLPLVLDMSARDDGSYGYTVLPYTPPSLPAPAPTPVYPPVIPVRDKATEALAEAIETTMTPSGAITIPHPTAPGNIPSPVARSVAAILHPCTVHGLAHSEVTCPRHRAYPPPNPAQASIPSVTGSDPMPEPEPEPIAPVIHAPANNPPIPAPTVKVAPIAKRDPSGLMHFPVRNATDKVVMAKEEADVLETYWRKHEAGDQSIIAIVGPSGTGKTSLIWDLAADKQVGLFMFDAAGASSFTDWTGTTVLRQGEGSPVTEFITSSFIEFARIDGPCAGQFRIGGIDELNRAESGGALNALLPILAQGQLFIPELGDTVVFDPKVLWMFTMNRGSAYNATLSLDAALADRVQAWVKLDNLTEAAEIKLLIERTGVDAGDADRLVKTAQQIREVADRGELTHSISIRRTLDAARAVKHGLTLKQAATFCWANSYLDEGGKESDRGRVITAIEATLGTAKGGETPW